MICVHIYIVWKKNGIHYIFFSYHVSFFRYEIRTRVLLLLKRIMTLCEIGIPCTILRAFYWYIRIVIGSRVSRNKRTTVCVSARSRLPDHCDTRVAWTRPIVPMLRKIFEPAAAEFHRRLQRYSLSVVTAANDSSLMLLVYTVHWRLVGSFDGVSELESACQNLYTQSQ